MKLRLASLLLMSSIVQAQEFEVVKKTTYGAYPQEVYTVKEKSKAGKLTPSEAFKNDIPFTHILVTDSKYATLVGRTKGSCVDNRNEILATLESKMSNVDEIDRLEYLAYVDMRCVILKSNMDPMQHNGYARELAYHINDKDELRILNYPGWWKCNRLEDRYAFLGQFFKCKETKQLYN